MTLFSDLRLNAKTTHNTVSYQLDETWAQGRAIYGGLSTSLCLDAVQRLLTDLPPLRSATVSFIGPGSDSIWVEVRELRRGKSIAFVEANLIGESGLITRCVFSFGRSRESRLAKDFGAELYGDKLGLDPMQAPDFYEVAPEYQNFVDNRPSFTQHFDGRLQSGTRPFLGDAKPSMEVWTKHKDPKATDLVSLIALADLPPPAVAPMLKGYAPFSSVSWMFNVLSDNPSSESGWWLLGTFAEAVQQGYASQNMTVHNDRGELVMTGRQSVAMFY